MEQFRGFTDRRDKVLETPFWQGMPQGPTKAGTAGLGLKRAIVRPENSEPSFDGSLFESPEFVTRLTRVAQLWHYVLVSRALVYFACAFFPGLPGFFDRPSQWLVLARRTMLWGTSCMTLIALGTLLTSIAMFVSSPSADATPYVDAFAAIRIGAVLVAEAAVAIERPAFFAFAGATALGGAIGKASMPFAFAAMIFLFLLIVMVREDARHQRRTERANRKAISDQQRALNLVRDFERAGRGWFWETDRHGQLVYISPTVAAKLGRAPSDLRGKPFTDIIRKRIGNDESEERTLGFSLSSRTPFKELTVQAAVPGEERWWSISGHPISNALGNFQGLRGRGLDLTVKT